MSEPARILLRLLGFVLFLAGVAIVVLMITPGPTEIAHWMGQNCDPNSKDLDTSGPDQQCTVWDVLGWLWWAPILILVGGVLALALGPEREGGPRTIDLSGLRRR
jgi:hypothetical protein